MERIIEIIKETGCFHFSVNVDYAERVLLVRTEQEYKNSVLLAVNKEVAPFVTVLWEEYVKRE
jgi:hypothetical protein